MYIYWFTWILFFIVVYVIQKIGGNKNSTSSLNILVNYHYHGENWVITRLFPSILMGVYNVQKHLQPTVEQPLDYKYPIPPVFVASVLNQ